jgi:putative hydrolase of the HAD superfamily
MMITTILCDLDNTLYPLSAGLTQAVDERMTEYVQRHYAIGLEEALALRQEFFAAHGSTLRGMLERGFSDSEDYMRYVHAVEYAAYLKLDAELDTALDALPARKVIFTNAPAEHAEAVLKVLGLRRHFERIFDIRFMQFRAKPDPQAYRRVLAELACTPREALLIEDTAHNLPPARELGITNVFIGDAAATDCADFVAPTILDALGFVRGLMAVSG